MNDNILKEYRENILNKLDNLLNMIRREYYRNPNKELKNILDRAEKEFYKYCEKYISLAEQKKKNKTKIN